MPGAGARARRSG